MFTINRTYVVAAFVLAILSAKYVFLCGLRNAERSSPSFSTAKQVLQTGPGELLNGENARRAVTISFRSR